MPEFNNALLYNAGRLARNDTDIVANLPEGAQLGYGNHLPAIDVATPLVLPNTSAIVLSLPSMFARNPTLHRYEPYLKTLFESHAKSIEGVDIETSLEGGTTPIGHDGQNLEMPTKSSRTQPSPTFVFQELTGNLIWNLIYNWIRFTKDYDTQLATASAVNYELSNVPPQLMSTFSMDMLFIQYDTTGRPENILDGHMITCMWPKSPGPYGQRRAIGEASAMPERSINFSGVLQYNENTKKIARNVAEILSIHRIDYDLSTPIAERVSARLEDLGLRAEIERDVVNFRSNYGDLSSGTSSFVS